MFKFFKRRALRKRIRTGEKIIVELDAAIRSDPLDEKSDQYLGDMQRRIVLMCKARKMMSAISHLRCELRDLSK